MPHFALISTYIQPKTSVWAWCGAPFPCWHHAALDLPAIIDRYGDMPLDELKRRLRCTGCGWRPADISLVQS